VNAVNLLRRTAAEFFGTAVLVATVVGSGHMAQALTADIGVGLMMTMLATVFVLGLLIFLVAPVSGAHLNPAVSLALMLRAGFPARDGLAYIGGQVSGALLGTVGAQAMFGSPLAELAQYERIAPGVFLGEVVATAGLITIIVGSFHQRRVAWLPLLVPAWIGAGHLFTSSTSFANPAVTVARMFTDSFTGIHPASVPWFVAAQILGVVVALVVVRIFENAPAKEGSR
jgi:glycerol uptake facilitator-like aquaporin